MLVVLKTADYEKSRLWLQCFLNIQRFEMKHFICLISKINIHGSKANAQMCWKRLFLRGAGTLPKRMPLVLGLLKFIVTHGLCRFMGLFRQPRTVSAGGSSALLDAQIHFLLGRITVCVVLTWSWLCRVSMISSMFDSSDPPSSFKRLCGGFDLMRPFLCIFVVVHLMVMVLCWTVKRELLVLVRIKVRNEIVSWPKREEKNWK